jgi:hypothetical protein
VLLYLVLLLMPSLAVAGEGEAVLLAESDQCASALLAPSDPLLPPVDDPRAPLPSVPSCAHAPMLACGEPPRGLQPQPCASARRIRAPPFLC